MKNLKKIAALVIVLALALSTVSFAAYTDVKEDASYSEAVTVMSALGLLKGYEDGTFGPDKTITRAEFAAVVVRMLGMEDAAAGAATATNFADVPATHWAAGYVKIANQKEIIAGYGDGNFGPDAEVTYEQAIKMLVCALGYAPMFADVKDAYPTSYMAQANTLGMTVGAAGKIGDKATRAIVARLVYNALDDKIMEQISFGKDKEYGIPTLYSTPLAQYLKIAKVDATVAPVGFTAEDAAKVRLSDVKYEGAANGSMYGGEYRDVNIVDGEYDAVEGVIIPKGYTVTAYIDYNDDDMVVLAVVPKAGKNEVLELTGTQMEGAAIDFANGKLSYYKNSVEVDSKAQEVKIDKELLTIYENQNTAEYADLDTLAANYAAGIIPSLKLINNDTDAAYDVIVFTTIESGVVEDIYDGDFSVGTTNRNYSFDEEDEDMTFTLVDTNGKELKFSDIKVGDILNVMVSEDDNGAEYYEYIVSADKVEGTVTELSSDGEKAYIGGKEYKTGGVTVNAGDKGIFYVDICGVILDKELDASSRTFGLLYSLYKDVNGADEEIKATIFTKDGKFENFTFAKNVSINEGTVAKVDLAVDTVAAPQLVMYSANSAGAINAITEFDKINTVAEDYVVADYSDVKKLFSADDNTIAGMNVVDSTVIVAYENTELSNKNAKEDYALTSKSIFADEEGYKVMYIADANSDDLVFAIVFDAQAKVEPSAPVMVVSAAPSNGETADGDAYAIVKGYVNGELKSFNVDLTDANIYAAADESALDASVITKGAIIQYNEGELASAIRVIATAGDVAKIIANPADDSLFFGEDYRDEDTGYFAYGKIAKYESPNIYFDMDGDYKFDAEKGDLKVNFKTGIKAVKYNYVNDRFYNGNYSIASAESYKKISDADAMDDIVIIYSFDKESLGCVIIDVAGDNK